MASTLQDKYIPIVLCAGFGTRLKPLTDFIPKVVCPLIDKPFAFYNIEKFFKAGFSTVHCNTHYLPEIVKKELISACGFFKYDPNRIRFWDEENILETGGGVARIFNGLCREDLANQDKDLIVVSGDIVADFPLTQMISRWENKREDEFALMCTRNMKIFRKDATYVNENLTHVLGFGEKFLEEEDSKNLRAKVFTNHQIISGHIVENCAVQKKSSIDLFYRSIINSGNKVINFDYKDSLYWFNIGTCEEYLECIDYFLKVKNVKNNLNYSFHLPESLGSKIETYVKNSLHLPSKIESNKIGISFRNNPNILGKYIPLKEVCKINDGEEAVYFYL